MLNRLPVLILCLLVASCTATGSKLEKRLHELEAREAIRALFTAYGRTLDDRDFSAFAELYTRDAEYIGGGSSTPVRGAQAIADSLEDIITSNASGANLHVFFNEQISIADDGRSASAISRGAFYVQDEAGNPIPLMFATYIDELKLENRRWLFSKRQVIGDIPGPSNESRAQSNRR